MNGKTFDQDVAKDIYAGYSYLARGSKVELVDLRRIDADCIDVQIQAQNKKGFKHIHIVYTINDSKIAKAQVIDN